MSNNGIGGTRQRFRHNNFQNQNAFNPNQLHNNGGIQATDGNRTPEQEQMDRLEGLLKKFMEAMQAQQQGGAQQGGAAPAGGAQQAGGAKAGGAQDPMFSLEELLKQLRDLAQKNPQAVQQFLAQNPQLAQMLGDQIGAMPAMGGGAGAGVGGGGTF